MGNQVPESTVAPLAFRTHTHRHRDTHKHTSTHSHTVAALALRIPVTTGWSKEKACIRVNCTLVCMVRTIWPLYAGLEESKPAVDVLHRAEDSESHVVASQAEPWTRIFKFDGRLPKPWHDYAHVSRPGVRRTGMCRAKPSHLSGAP
jgi:hypothetical protein